MGGVIVDVLCLAIIVSYAVFGWRHGFLFVWFALVGLLVGAVVAYFAVPAIGSLIGNEIWRALIGLCIAILLVVAGQVTGSYVGDQLEREVKRPSTHIIDAIAGAAFNTVVTAIVLTVLASSVVGLGIVSVTRSIASSRMMMLITAIEPDPLQRTLAQVQSSIASRDVVGFSTVVSDLLSPMTPASMPTDSPQLVEAAKSVVLVSGSALDCMQSQTGTGFVVAPGRVLTNAHVVAGVVNPVVSAPDGQIGIATVVYFDSRSDIALLAVPALTATPLAIGATATAGTQGAIVGYSFGGPESVRSADVLAVKPVMVKDIYGTSSNDREVYVVRGTVRDGDSGAPLLDERAVVRGMVFARTTDAGTTEKLGYAMTSAEFEAVASMALSFYEPVHSGDCVQIE